jgi:hypothetical protein
VVIDEAVLYREVGGREVLRRQLRRLLDASQRPGVELLVVPFSAGAHAALTESFVIFEFAAGQQRAPVVHSEGLTAGNFAPSPPRFRSTGMPSPICVPGRWMSANSERSSPEQAKRLR